MDSDIPGPVSTALKCCQVTLPYMFCFRLELGHPSDVDADTRLLNFLFFGVVWDVVHLAPRVDCDTELFAVPKYTELWLRWFTLLL